MVVSQSGSVRLERFPQKWELVLRSESAQVFEIEPVFSIRLNQPDRDRL